MQYQPPFVLVHPDFSEDFIVYIYGGEHSIAVVLTQKEKEQKAEHPIVFYSRTLWRYEAK